MASVFPFSAVNGLGGAVFIRIPERRAVRRASVSLSRRDARNVPSGAATPGRAA
ncbi:Uncharacterised protein [Bordetella pertussis]|nr:Uncharacterised protein [Bordetella pertussis]